VAITLDNATNNDKANAILKHNLQGRGKLYFDGLFFFMLDVVLIF
jgi:hypothetical protein